MKMRVWLAAILAVASPAYAADNMTVKDGTGATKVLAKKDVGSVLYDKNIIVLQSDVTVDAMAQIDGHVDGIESLLTTETNNTSGISAKLPATLGSKTGAASLSVVPANDGFAVQCTSGCSGGTQYNEDAASANGDAGTVALAVRKATPANTSGADGDYEALQINAGNLWTKDSALNTAIGTTSDSTVTSGFTTCSVIACLRAVANAALDTTPATINQTQVNGVTLSTGNGVAGTGVQRVTIASDNTAFTVNAAQSGTWNVTNVSGTVSLPTGAATAAKQPALGTAGTASSDVISVQGIASMTPLQTRNSGTSTPVRVVSAAASTNLTEIADSGGCRVVSVSGAVARTSAVYLKFYNAADGSVTVGTTTPYITLALPAGGTNPTSFQFDVNQVFASGACSLAMTTAVADNSTAALTAADVVGLTVIWGTN